MILRSSGEGVGDYPILSYPRLFCLLPYFCLCWGVCTVESGPFGDSIKSTIVDGGVGERYTYKGKKPRI